MRFREVLWGPLGLEGFSGLLWGLGVFCGVLWGLEKFYGVL